MITFLYMHTLHITWVTHLIYITDWWYSLPRFKVNATYLMMNLSGLNLRSIHDIIDNDDRRPRGRRFSRQIVWRLDFVSHASNNRWTCWCTCDSIWYTLHKMWCILYDASSCRSGLFFEDNYDPCFMEVSIQSPSVLWRHYGSLFWGSWGIP